MITILLNSLCWRYLRGILEMSTKEGELIEVSPCPVIVCTQTLYIFVCIFLLCNTLMHFCFRAINNLWWFFCFNSLGWRYFTRNSRDVVTNVTNGRVVVVGWGKHVILQTFFVTRQECPTSRPDKCKTSKLWEGETRQLWVATKFGYEGGVA